MTQQTLDHPDDENPRHGWAHAYISALPGELRPHAWDARARDAMRVAYNNGWAPAQLASLVAAGGYARIRNRPLAAVRRLEDIGGHPPTATPRPVQASGCPVCPPRERCEQPAAAIPRQWTQERADLVRQLRATPTAELAEDDRGQLMADLIALQRRR